MDIKYTLTFYDEWHCGSGLASGADMDALVVKDKDGLPFVPGKTIKGLVREAVENIIKLRGETDKYRETFVRVFGNAEDMDWNMLVDKESVKMRKGEAFFTNAELNPVLVRRILDKNLKEYMYGGVSNTAIGEDGIAIDHSLRRTEIVVPCELYGEILNVRGGMVNIVVDGLKMIKRLGQNRNRGLGRCDFRQIGGNSND
jgi:CRISPR/Cas system CSM-associated protein Csm3 (group 7 of RAMP superfamily)